MSNQVSIEVVPAVVPAVQTTAPAVATVVEITAPGPQGPAGPPGAAYVHSQPTPATTWTINHNLGHYPSVELFSSGMQEIDAEIAHPSVNQTVVTLKPAIAGLARLI